MADFLSEEISVGEVMNAKLSKIISPSSCSSCGSVNIKYRCPRCDIKTCSLACVKKHKVITSCSGRRDKTNHVIKSELNEKHLLNDYRFLEEGHRVADNAQRDQNYKQKYFSRNVKKLRNEACHRGVKLRLMPVGFQKRKENTSCFHFKSKVIFWRIKWEFPQANAEYVEAKLSENKSIKTLLEKYLHPTLADPVFKQRLKNYHDEEIKVFLRNYSTHHTSFFEIDTSKTVKEALKGKVVIEYPMFHVVLSRHFSEYPTDIPCPNEKILDWLVQLHLKLLENLKLRMQRAHRLKNFVHKRRRQYLSSEGVKRQRLENQEDSLLINDNDGSDFGSEVVVNTLKCEVVEPNTGSLEEGVKETNTSNTFGD